jgi:competence protein ComEC
VLPDEAPVTVLKVAHHGSKHSSSETFLRQIMPKEAVISVGENNYGHPDPGVLGRLQALGTVIRRTDVSGDITYRCTDQKQCVYTP